jgi:hypothetical protein
LKTISIKAFCFSTSEVGMLIIILFIDQNIAQ